MSPTVISLTFSALAGSINEDVAILRVLLQIGFMFLVGTLSPAESIGENMAVFGALSRFCIVSFGGTIVSIKSVLKKTNGCSSL